MHEVPAEFKLTDVGEIPSDWDVKLIGELGKVVRGGSPRPAGDPRYFNGRFIPWLTVAALTTLPESCMRVTRTRGYLTRKGSEKSRILPADTVIIANSGATLGVAKILKLRCCANDGIAALIEQHAGDKEFLCYYINTQTERLRDVVASGNGQPNLNTKLIRELPVPFPSKGEQRAIARALSDVDGLIASLEALIAKKQAIKQGMMQQLLTGKARLPGFKEPWVATTFGSLGTFLKGRGVKREDVRSAGVRCIRYGELYTVFHDYAIEARSFVSPDVATTALPLRSGDLLFAGSGETREEIGKCVAYVGPTPAVAGGDVIILRGDQYNPIYLALLANTPKVVSQKARAGQGDAVVHIYSHSLAAIEVRLPPRAEQDAIAQVVVDADREIGLLRHRLAKAKNIKQGMLQQLLTGRTRLPVEAAV